MLVGAWAVFSAALVGLGYLSREWCRRRFLNWRIDRRRIERRDWRAYVERRYRKP